MQFWLMQAFNGVSYGALLFLLASGLSLIFGVMRIVNLAHGSYFLLGGYVALTVIWSTGSWLLALPVSACAVAVLGMLMERLLLRRLGGEALRQVLLTAGIALLLSRRHSTSMVGTVGTWSGSMPCSHAWLNVVGNVPGRCQGASNKCWPLAASS